MPIQSEAKTVLYHDWSLRVRASGGGTARLLLLLHGWTGDENSMWVFARGIPLRFWIVAPRAPHATLPSGYSWRPPDVQKGDRASIDDFRPAVERLLLLVDAYTAEQNIDPREFDVIGFSQGAAVASTIALLHPERIGRVGMLAGFVPAGAETLLAKRPLPGKPFFVAHGTRDQMVRIEYARQSVHLLEEAGAQVTFCEDDVSHKVSVSCLRALDEFFT